MKINKLKSVFFLPLQSGKKVTSDPSPFVQFTVGHKSYESKVRTPTCSTFTPTNIKLFLFYQKALSLSLELLCVVSSSRPNIRPMSRCGRKPSPSSSTTPNAKSWRWRYD